MTADYLKECAEKLRILWESGSIRVPVHIPGGNEEELIEIFKEIKNDDWVISTHRNMFHHLLHGASFSEHIRALSSQGGSMVHASKNPPFISTGIVAGGCGIAVGLALAIKNKGENKRVWCFVGDGATDEGHFYEAVRYAVGYDLPVTFIVEDNDRATETTNEQRWGKALCEEVSYGCSKIRYYRYIPTYPHVGSGKYVQF